MITTAKPGDIVWCVCGRRPMPLFVHSWGAGELVRLTHRRDSDDVVERTSSRQLYHTFDALLLDIWKPREFDESCDQELKDAVSHAYNSGVGSLKPAQQPDRDFEMLLAMLCHPRNAKHFQGDPDILRLSHDAMRRFRKNYPGHSSFFDECNPQEPSESKPSDLVHRDGDKWYFWDETLAYRDGPYDTEDEARDKMQDYAETVLGHQPTNLQIHGSFEHSDGTMHCTPEVRAKTTFAQAMTDVTKVMKKLGDTLGSINPCGEIPLESTPPDTDANEFEGATIPSCPDCNVVETVFLPERKISAWADGECVCNYIKSRSHYTREHNFVGSRENFKKALVANLGNDIQCDDSFPEITLTLSELSGEEFPPQENFLTKEEAKKMWDEAGGCDCGGPDGHLPGGSHCRKPL